jgi:hypothetical protein
MNITDTKSTEPHYNDNISKTKGGNMKKLIWIAALFLLAFVAYGLADATYIPSYEAGSGPGGDSNDTVPLMRLNIINPTAGTIPGSVLSVTKNYTVTTSYAQTQGGTNVIFTLRQVQAGGTGSMYNLTSNQTATDALLTLTSFTGGTVPAGNLLVADINSVAGTVGNMRLEVYGVEY